MATSTPVLYNRRPVHTIIHFTLPHTHAGKCRSQCIHPRERDTQKQEVIVDNDGSLNGYGGQGSLYLEVKSRKARWQQTNQPGFAQQKRVYQDNENPFITGTARYAQTEKKKGQGFLSNGCLTFLKRGNMPYMCLIKLCQTV